MDREREFFDKDDTFVELRHDGGPWKLLSLFQAHSDVVALSMVILTGIVTLSFVILFTDFCVRSRSKRQRRTPTAEGLRQEMVEFFEWEVRACNRVSLLQ